MDPLFVQYAQELLKFPFFARTWHSIWPHTAKLCIGMGGRGGGEKQLIKIEGDRYSRKVTVWRIRMIRVITADPVLNVTQLNIGGNKIVLYCSVKKIQKNHITR